MRRIIFMSQERAEQYAPSFDDAIISITGQEPQYQGLAKLSSAFADGSILRLQFDDVGEVKGISRWTPMRMSDAHLILEFADKHQGCRDLIIHCLHGKSRSYSIATALGEIYQVPIEGYAEPLLNNLIYARIHLAEQSRKVSNDT